MTASVGKRLTTGMAPVVMGVIAAAILVAVCLILQSLRGMYERGLSGQHPPRALELGNLASEWLVIGDSRVAQWASHDSLNASYLGFPGASTWQISAFFSDTQLERVRGKRVILQFGINDLRLVGLRPKSKDTIAHAAADNLWRLAGRMSVSAKDVLVLSVLPAAEPSFVRQFVWDDAVDESVAEVNALLNGLSQSEGVSESIRFADLTDAFLLLRDTGYADTLHLNSQGYRRLNSLVEQELAVAIQ